MVETMAVRLEALRKRDDLSYAAFGDLAGVSAQAVQKWLNGGAVKEENLERLAKHFAVSPAWIRYGGAATTSLAAEARAGYGLTDIALDVARRWMSLSSDRQESFRDMIFTTHWMEQRFPVMRKGRPKGEHYDALEAAIEKDFRQLKLKLE